MASRCGPRLQTVLAREAWHVAAENLDFSNSVSSYLCNFTVFEWELLSSPERLNNMPKVKQFQSRS